MKLQPFGLKSVNDIRGISSAKISIGQVSERWPTISVAILNKNRVYDPFNILSLHRINEHIHINNGSKQVII